MRDNGGTTGTERKTLIGKFKCEACPKASRKAVNLSKEPCQHFRASVQAGKCQFTPKKKRGAKG